MKDEPENRPVKSKMSLGQKVGAEAERKMRARRHAGRTVWFGLGMVGLVGWSIVIPTLLGTALGVWLDKRHPGSHSWTITLLVVGLVVGCLIASQWVVKEHRKMRDELENGEDVEGKDE